MIQYHKRRIRNLKYSKVSYKVYDDIIPRDLPKIFVAYILGYYLLSIL